MNLKYIDAFLALAKYQNFSDAAAALYISQSSLSKYIKRLEDSLHVKLFARDSNGTKLTEYGQIYLKYALKINNLQTQCMNEIQRLHAKEHIIKIGSIPSSSEYGIIDTVLQFMKEFKIECQISNGPSGELEKQLENGQIDLAFIKNPLSEKLTAIHYQHDELVAVLPQNHPLANQKEVNLKQLKNEDFILEPVNSRPYNLCVKFCKQAGYTPNVIYADHQITNIIDFVQKGVGISLLMSKLVPKDNDGIVALPITPAVTADIDLCYLDNDKNSEYKKAFVDFLKKKENVF